MGRWLVRNAMIAIFPGGAGFPGIAECDLTPFLDRFDREAAFVIRLGLLAGAVVYQLTPLFTLGLPLPAAWLSVPRRERHLNRLITHPFYLVRQAVFLLKTVAGFCWGSHPTVRALYALPAYPEDPATWRTT